MLLAAGVLLAQWVLLKQTDSKYIRPKIHPISIDTMCHGAGVKVGLCVMVQGQKLGGPKVGLHP